MNQQKTALDQRLQEFRKKYYTDKIIRGSLILLLLFSSMLFIALLSEGMFGFSSRVRTVMVFGLGFAFLGVLGYMVLYPLSQLFNWLPNISDLQIASMIRRHFPDINDKLLNVLQLRSQAETNSLAQAAVQKKSDEISPVPLSTAINLRLNSRYLLLLLIPLFLFGLTYVVNPSFLSLSGHRLINYQDDFVPPPPFNLSVSSVPDNVVAGEEIPLKVTVSGDELPAELFLFIRNDAEESGQFIDYSMDKLSATEFAYTLSDLKEDFTFYIGNPEVNSEPYNVKVLKRPFIKNFKVSINYPAYTRLGAEVLEDNIGDFKVIKGATVTWELEPQGEVASAQFVAGAATDFAIQPDRSYQLTRRLMEDLEYYISLESPDRIGNIDTVRYRATILQDRYPSIYVFSPGNDFQVDLDPTLPLDLEIADDYGFNKMALFYRFTKSGGAEVSNKEFEALPLNIDARTLLQPKSYDIDLTRLGLDEGDEVEYYIKVWDNDAVSGPKAATSETFRVIYPTLDARYDEVTAQQDAVNEQLNELRKTADELNEAYKKMQEKLLDQKKLSFDDKKEVQRMMEEHQQMLKEMEQAQKSFEQTKEKLQENQMISEETLNKYDELNKFMEELKNPEIEELLEEIQEKMEELNPEDIKAKLEQLQMNDEEMKKSLERTLELLKQLEVQQKLDELRNKLMNLEAKQNLLKEKVDQAETPEELQDLSNRQEALEEQMDKVGEEMKELGDMKEDTMTPDSEQMEDLEKDAEEVKSEMEQASEQMKEASEQMQEGGRKNKKGAQESQQGASQSQQKAAQKLQEMQEQLEGMQSSMQSQQDQQNLESLRELLENLLKLSFDQEDLRDEVKELKYGDPALKDKSQQQKKLQDDMTLVRDSLEALANKVFQIQKFVLDESQQIDENMNKSQVFFRNKQIPMITYHQQGAMTNINNLANMLSDVMKQMQEQMMNAKPGQGMCQKPGDQQKPGMQGVSKQQQQLNQQMQQMMNSGQMDGEKLSEMAARQEAIRKQLQEAHDKIRENGGKALGDMDKVMQDMKESETEMMNKQLTHETMKRQQEILSRMLQADKSVREREWDNKRESKTGLAQEKKSPEELSREEYENKIRQEMLKSNKLEYSSDFIILIEQYYKKLEGANE